MCVYERGCVGVCGVGGERKSKGREAGPLTRKEFYLGAFCVWGGENRKEGNVRHLRFCVVHICFLSCCHW
jgi:hypothetical protein